MRSTGKYLRNVLALLSPVMTAAGFVMACSAASAAVPPPVTRLGVWNGSPGSVPAGAHPDVLNDYVYWGNAGIGPFLATAAAHDATAFIEIEPWQGGGPSDCQGGLFGTVAAGSPSAVSYEKAVGSAVAAGGKPVILTFAHEFNVSGQYPWALGNGCGVTSAEWKQAWDSVVANVRSTAGGLAYFMWAPNAYTGGSTQEPDAWWPGAATVDMTGVDGYPDTQYGSQFGSFAGEFGPVFADIRALPGFSSLPRQGIFVSETDLARLGSPGYQSVTAFTQALCAGGGDGVLQFQDGTPALSAAQWADLEAALARYCGSPPGPAPSGTPAVTAPVTQEPPVTPPATVTPAAAPSSPAGLTAPGAPHVTGRFPATVTWSAPPGPVTYYQLLVMTSRGTVLYDEQVTVPAAQLYLGRGTRVLKVRACNQQGCSPYSASVTYTT